MSITHLRLWAYQRNNWYLIGRGLVSCNAPAAGTGGSHWKVNAPPVKDALALLAKRFKRRTYRID
ncbi:hypothetical protein KSP39_PZI011690 [Platanthera zijinensis]|uniref:Uncharacterized protein n=1 Tax=Platanthera zijinensis TaxID=2320716 RepID=A0AAP0BH83_9ASPA